MFRPDPQSPEFLAEVNALAEALESIRRRRPRARVEVFADRRRALLETHLGRPLTRDPEPIVCLGDSHTMFFAGTDRMRFIRYRRQGFLRPRWINRGLDLLPLFRSFHLGPCTAWMAAEFGTGTRGREKLAILLRRDLVWPAQQNGHFGMRSFFQVQGVRRERIEIRDRRTTQKLGKRPDPALPPPAQRLIHQTFSKFRMCSLMGGLH